MKREVMSPQRAMRFIGLIVDGTGTAAIREGGAHATLVDNGAGDYTITLRQAFARKPIVTVTCATDDCYAELVDADNTTSVIHVKTKNNADAATDAVFHMQIMGSDVADAA